MVDRTHVKIEKGGGIWTTRYVHVCMNRKTSLQEYHHSLYR